MPAPTCASAIPCSACTTTPSSSCAAESSTAEAAEGLRAAFLVVLGLRRRRRLLRVEHPVCIGLSSVRRMPSEWYPGDEGWTEVEYREGNC